MYKMFLGVFIVCRRRYYQSTLKPRSPPVNWWPVIVAYARATISNIKSADELTAGRMELFRASPRERLCPLSRHNINNGRFQRPLVAYQVTRPNRWMIFAQMLETLPLSITDSNPRARFV